MGAFSAFMLCGFVALAGLVTGNWLASVIPALIAWASWRYLRKLPTWTPREGGPGTWL
jgi:hypothetical protein